MSRSYKKPIYKDKGYDDYNKHIRHTQNNELRSQLFDDLYKLEIPNKKTIVNDWKRCDFIIDHHNMMRPNNLWNCQQEKYDEDTIKMRRK